MNYYVLLGVSPSADVDTIRSAFRALVRRYHPDAGEGSSPKTVREIVEAYETLSDPARRRRYDETLEPIRSLVSRGRHRFGARAHRNRSFRSDEVEAVLRSSGQFAQDPGPLSTPSKNYYEPLDHTLWFRF